MRITATDREVIATDDVAQSPCQPEPKGIWTLDLGETFQPQLMSILVVGREVGAATG
jgi:hypothetical protein